MSSIEEVTSGTQAATLDTEHTLATLTEAEAYMLVTDLAAMQAADVTILRVYVKVLAGGTEHLAFTQTYEDAQTEDVVFSVPIPSAHSARFSLEQTDGTGRSYPWSVLKVV